MDTKLIIFLSAIVALFLCFLLSMFRASRKIKKLKAKQAMTKLQEQEEARSKHIMAMAERNFYKKCRKCGMDVPKADNICGHCNDIP